MTEYASMTNDELDALAAERAMGWATDGPDDDLPIAMWHEKHLGHICAVTEWRPTTDPRDERAVVDAMVARGSIQMSICRTGNGWCAYFANPENGTDGVGAGNTPGRAVVIAALIAVESGEEE